MMLTIYSKVMPLALVITLMITLSGCAKDINPRGNLPHKEALSQLQLGEQTRQDVQLLLGTPSTTATFDDETWYYVSAQTTTYAFYPMEELDRQVFAITFDSRGILKSMRILGIDDGEEVAVADRETPTMGREFSIIEQLIGNLGRFDRGRPEAGP